MSTRMDEVNESTGLNDVELVHRFTIDDKTIATDAGAAPIIQKLIEENESLRVELAKYRREFGE